MLYTINSEIKINWFLLKIIFLLFLFLSIKGQINHLSAAGDESSQKEVLEYPATPKGVVEALLKAGFDVVSIKELVDMNGDVKERSQYFDEFHPVGHDCLPIVLDFKVLKLQQDSHEAKIKVKYEYIGYQCAESLHIKDKSTKEVIYRLSKKANLWKIYFPTNPPHISINTAIRLFKYQMEFKTKTSSKLINKKIKRNIDILKKYKKDHNLN
jgi:hypothetical protein